ncbi:ComF family protein [Terrisporobacter petrolearius]|uniref:ComF family protein n=1 Tax=Terrisporobacter petrolearius TaxID=1460447 RepID=UPI003AFF7A65
MKLILKLIPNNIKETIKIAINYIYPRNITCIICDNPIKLKNPYSLCRSCFKELRFILDGCNKCGKPIINRNLERESLIECNYCYNKTFYFDKAIACIEYDDISKKLILDFKYKSKTYLCRYVAYLMKEKIILEDIKADYILFVPLHNKRLKKRGFNQAEKIANKLSDLINIPVLDCVSREKNTKKLYRLNKEDREKELKNGFKVKDNINLIKNKNVILIDDIFTTGSTANEISKVLKINSVNNICIFTLLTTCVDVYVKE